MSGRELDPDDTDSYHPQHPWEQSGSRRYIAPHLRAKSNWPPVAAIPAGPYEAAAWEALPDKPLSPPEWYRVCGADRA